MEHQNDNTQHTERANSDDNFEIFKPRILMAIVKIKGKKKRADIDAIRNFIVQADAASVNKNIIKDFVTQLVAQKLLIKKNTSQGNGHIIKHQRKKIYLNRLDTLKKLLLKKTSK